jgi:SH3-like domain-containing protein
MQGKQIHWRVLLPLGLLFLTMLACGGFQVRVTPTPTSTPPRATIEPAARPTAVVIAPTTAVPTATLTPTAVLTATVTPGFGLAPGKAVRVTASGGLNVRDQASTSGKQVGKLNPGAVVKLRSGPKEANGYTWWQIDDGAGLVGWVAAGTKEDPWLVLETAGVLTATGGGKLVNRDVRLGDRVQVTTQEGKVLTIREAAGKDAKPVARVLPGTQFVVRGGPVRQDGYLWWQLEGEQIKGWAAEGEPGDRWLTPVEP